MDGWTDREEDEPTNDRTTSRWMNSSTAKDSANANARLSGPSADVTTVTFGRIATNCL